MRLFEGIPSNQVSKKNVLEGLVFQTTDCNKAQRKSNAFMDSWGNF